MSPRLTLRVVVCMAAVVLLPVLPGAAGAQNLSTDYFAAMRAIVSYTARGRHDVVLDIVQQARGDIPAMKEHPIWPAAEGFSLIALGRYPQALTALDSVLAMPPERFKYPDGFPQETKAYLTSEHDLKLLVHLNKATALLRNEQREEGIAAARMAEDHLKLWTGDIGTHFTAALALCGELADAGEGAMAERLAGKVEGLMTFVQFANALSFFGPSKTDLAKFREGLDFDVAIVRGNSRYTTSDYQGALTHYGKAHDYSSLRLAPYHLGQLKLKSRMMHALNRLQRFDQVPGLMPAELYQVRPGSPRPAVNAYLLNAHAEMGHALQSLGRPAEAITHWQSLVDGIEQQRNIGGLTPSQRQQQFSRWIPYYRRLARLQIAAGMPAKAFEQAELSKSRLLLESITSGNADSTTLLPPADRDRLKDYAARIGSLQSQITHTTDPQKTAQLQQQSNTLNAELQAVRTELYKQYPRYAAISQIAPVTKADAELLPPGSVFVSYMLVPNLQADEAWRDVQAFAFVLKGDGEAPAVVDLGMFKDFEGLTSAYLAALSEPLAGDKSAGDKRAALGRELSDRLLAPLARHIAEAKHLVFSADGPLALLPLEALPLGDKAVVELHDVSYVQSLSVLALLKQRQREYQSLDRRSLFAMGAPRYEDPAAPKAETSGGAKDARSAGGARATRAGHLRNAAAAGKDQSVLKSLGMRWSELPGAEAEIRDVSALFPDSKAYVREQATESKLLELNASNELANYRYLLFSAHAYLNTEVPELSALVLGQVQIDPGTDGFITAAKWPTYNIRSDLTVLSACQTGAGKVVYGEGILGLPYALYVAGNRSTALSLWEIDDGATAHFMKTFFRHLKAGRSQSEAINATKRELLKNRQVADPFYWAPFVLYGV